MIFSHYVQTKLGQSFTPFFKDSKDFPFVRFFHFLIAR
ncbi:hypothetical protein Bsph_4185 [Lysinibacillus sphaericus C3-41]|uniref:Uncharacterized protein n=1 Tax=Lysinibacillus sphaericus (strain C3-41) TaxID=444177 RepID=B1HX70_LYSSC|nr:hypothetical protein Bsph_4185 [Lysinibacillus sphaericus C3-41]